MHRQSLGSPGSKHLDTASAEDSSPAVTVNYDDEEEQRKSVKYLSKSENYVHLIPVLTVVCFLVLYLSSHDPSANDLAQFSGFKAFSKPSDTESKNSSDFPKSVDMKRGDILATRNRSLRDIYRETKKARSNRKMADF